MTGNKTAVRDRRSRPVRPVREFYHLDKAGRNVWHCSECGRDGLWKKGWCWYGSYAEMEGKVGERSRAVHGIREVLCPSSAKEKGAEVSGDAWEDDA